MDGDVAVTQLAAEVRQVLLATTVDIEQRWQFLTPQDRVAAVSDVVFVAVLYNRLFADGVGVTRCVVVHFRQEPGRCSDHSGRGSARYWFAD